MKAAKLLALSLAAVLLVQQGASGQTCPPDPPPVPVGTAFTYQGLLTCTPGGGDQPKLVDDTCNFKFDLYDCQTGGSLIATAQTVRDLNDPNKTLCAPGPKCPVTVIDGHFAVQLDFGNVYDGSAFFLEITVECPSPCQAGQAPLEPRQELTPVPYALFAQKGPTLADDDWDIDKDPPNMFAIPTGNVGIGIGANPAQAKLHVDKDISVTGNSATRVTFSNVLDSISTRGISVESVPLELKGGQTGVIANTSKIAGPDPQRGAATGRLATVYGFSGQGRIRGVFGLSTPNVLSNYDATRTSEGLGGYFLAKPDDTLTLNSTGTYWVGGVYGEVANTINGTPTLGAVAGVIGVDNNQGSAQSFAGYFDGKGYFSGNVGIGTTTPAAKLTVNGAILREGSTMSGADADTHINLGTSSTTDGYYSTVAGGRVNIASGNESTVGGGGWNTASDNQSTVAGGMNNTASGQYATVGGGAANTASGMSATVGGGAANVASGTYSFAAGYKARANHQGSFVWGDSTEAFFASTANDQFLIRAAGGVGIGTNAPTEKLDVNGRVRVRDLPLGGIDIVTADADGVLHKRAAGAGATVPIGAVIDWVPPPCGVECLALRRSIWPSIPPGYQVCNGSPIFVGPYAGTNTPDLVNKFVRGAAPDTIGATGGSDDHAHPYTSFSHTHPISDHNHSISMGSSNSNRGRGPCIANCTRSLANGDHTHSTTVGSCPSCTSGVNDEFVSPTEPWSNVPAYVGLLKIMRIF